MKTFRRAKIIAIYHAAESLASTRGVKITYSASADVTTKGRFVPAGTVGSVQPGGVVTDGDAVVFVDDSVDVRPLAGSAYDEYPRDRIVIDSQKYLVLRARKIDSFGGCIRVDLVTERE